MAGTYRARLNQTKESVVINLFTLVAGYSAVKGKKNIPAHDHAITCSFYSITRIKRVKYITLAWLAATYKCF